VRVCVHVGKTRGNFSLEAKIFFPDDAPDLLFGTILTLNA
jgi:hypothetical protein